MSHQPERPQEYVCTDCHVIHAGIAHGSPGDHSYEPPQSCGACGSESLVKVGEYPLQV